MTVTAANLLDAIEMDLDLDYAVDVEVGEAGYPSLQATNYEPSALTGKALKAITEEDLAPSGDYMKIGAGIYERPRMALPEDAFGLLEDAQAARLGAIAESATFTHDGEQKEVILMALPPSVRFVFLGKPGLFKLNKHTDEISRVKKGDKLGNGINTLVSVLMALVVDGEPILNPDGGVQIFRLKLSSTKSALISGDKKYPNMRSMKSLNEALLSNLVKAGKLDAKAAKTKSLTHKVSVAIVPNPTTFVKSDGQSKTGIMFEMVGGAQPVSKSGQRLIHELISTDEFKAAIADPFGINGRVEVADKPIELNEAEDIEFPA